MKAIFHILKIYFWPSSDGIVCIEAPRRGLKRGYDYISRHAPEFVILSASLTDDFQNLTNYQQTGRK